MNGPGWTIQIRDTPKEIRGEVIKMADELPDEGSQYIVTKLSVQFEMAGSYRMNLFREIELKEENLREITDAEVVVCGKYKRYHLFLGAESPILLNEELCTIMQEQAGVSLGPVMDPEGYVYWYSGGMAVRTRAEDMERLTEESEKTALVTEKVWQALKIGSQPGGPVLEASDPEKDDAQ